MSASESKSVVIIGAGIGGLASAARLGVAGMDVTVVEKQDYCGGRCSLLHDRGHRFDRGPSFYLMPKTFDETFQDLNERVFDWLDLRKREPNYRVYYHDGDTVELTTDMSRTKETVENNFESLMHVLRPSFVLPALRMHVFNKMYPWVSHFFQSDKMRKAFTFASMYLGMSPYDAPATYSLLQYTELAEGIWYPVGGFHTVPAALETIARKHGVRFRYTCSVKRILVNDDHAKATGVLLENGEIINADSVICNADLIWAYNHLLPKTAYSRRLENKKLTSSSISFYWSLKKSLPKLAIHNIFLAEQYRESFDSIFKKSDLPLPTDVSFYVNVPNRFDPSAAPEGKDTLVVLCPVGVISEDGGQDWDAIQTRARSAIVARLSQRLNETDFELLIEHEMISGPREWRDEFNLHRGSILGLSHDIFQILWFRPSTRHAGYSNLYFSGASVQPGTGVPIVLCGAKLTTEQLLRDNGVECPWNRTISIRQIVGERFGMKDHIAWRSTGACLIFVIVTFIAYLLYCE